jgi:hypothetical protein
LSRARKESKLTCSSCAKPFFGNLEQKIIDANLCVTFPVRLDLEVARGPNKPAERVHNLEPTIRPRRDFNFRPTWERI